MCFIHNIFKALLWVGIVYYWLLSIVMILETLDKQEGVPKVYNRMEVQVNYIPLLERVYIFTHC